MLAEKAPFQQEETISWTGLIWAGGGGPLADSCLRRRGDGAGGGWKKGEEQTHTSRMQIHLLY